jgi:hypothetical protein
MRRSILLWPAGQTTGASDTGQTGRVDVNEARLILGVTGTADEVTIREAHRREIRRVHPDAGGSEAAARRVNAAWDLLQGIDAAVVPVAPASRAASVPSAPPDVDQYYLVDVAADELLTRLAEAGHEVGEVVFVDPHVGILEIVVGDAPSVGQLAVTVGEQSAEGTEISFTLEPLGITPAPPIGPVVDALMAAIRR